MFGHGRLGQAMAQLLFLGMTAALARGCLQCDPNFSEKFAFYRHHVNLKSWWVGDIPVSGVLLSEWIRNTMKELHLAIPAEITRKKLYRVAEAVYQRMDQLYQGKMYFPGRIDCQRHCGIFQYETISCSNCTDSHVICFGYYCKSSTQWESAVQGLVKYINTWHKQDVKMRTTPAFLSPNIKCLEPQHLINLTLEDASKCLTQH
ncbi:izumo sperm-egg fusion protein 4 isoform X3 [Mastomys coucha]|uniref:izumo sperm-egg fusion protein 4 isoform X3 n=1 Tax=Mastomys coucha TaxID=35658 RepID=UPI001261C3FA|nr:izumo sperm-egg fusion protein 4 isoform X3 [Mastomys coucha]